MHSVVAVDVVALRDALDRQDWKVVDQVLPRLPLALDSKASSSELASVLETVRSAADCFAEACTFSSSFEAVFFAREALVKKGVCKWAANALEGFQNVISVVSPLATLLSLLALSNNGRHLVGSTGAVDLLTKIWKKHPSCLEIVSSLSCLCSGHIDNVSRVMRQRGIVTATQVLDDERYYNGNHQLIEKVLLLVGFTAICIPDNTDEARSLVPSVLGALERLNASALPNVAVHAIAALGNMGDCWLKESDGYQISDADSVINAVTATWKENPRSSRVIESASRTLLVLSATHPTAKEALLTNAKDLQQIISMRRKPDSVVKAVREIIETALRTNHGKRGARGIDEHSECELENTPKPKRKIVDYDDADGSDCEDDRSTVDKRRIEFSPVDVTKANFMPLRNRQKRRRRS